MPDPTLSAAANPPNPLVRERLSLVERYRDLGLRLVHAVAIAGSALAAWGLAVAIAGTLPDSGAFAATFWTVIAAKMIAAELFRLHQASWRWFGSADAAAVTVANTSGSVLAALALGARAATPAMAAVLVIEWLVSQAALLGGRMLFRLLRESRDRSPELKRRRALIYGAGRQGVNLLRQLRANPRSVYDIVGFIDDDPRERHRMIQMNPVLGNGDELPRLAELHAVDEVLIAGGCGDRESRGRIRELARFAGLRCRFLRPPRPQGLCSRRLGSGSSGMDSRQDRNGIH